MNSFVLDASITLAWCFKDEQTSFTQSLMKKIDEFTIFVPSIWSLEISNVLIMAERQNRIKLVDVTNFIANLECLNIKVDDTTSMRSFHDILNLAYSKKMTTYDAAYLELALRTGFPLASKDKHLCKVAKSFGVQILN